MIGHESCPGCMYSGGTHLETCPEALHNKYGTPMLVTTGAMSVGICRFCQLNIWSTESYCSDAGVKGIYHPLCFITDKANRFEQALREIADKDGRAAHIMRKIAENALKGV